MMDEIDHYWDNAEVYDRILMEIKMMNRAISHLLKIDGDLWFRTLFINRQYMDMLHTLPLWQAFDLKLYGLMYKKKYGEFIVLTQDDFQEEISIFGTFKDYMAVSIHPFYEVFDGYTVGYGSCGEDTVNLLIEPGPAARNIAKFGHDCRMEMFFKCHKDFKDMIKPQRNFVSIRKGSINRLKCCGRLYLETNGFETIRRYLDEHAAWIKST